MQLVLVTALFLFSRGGSSASLASGISSILVIGKVGVESFLNRHDEKLAKTSLLGKICLAASVLPVFVLTALFKIGSIAITYVWDEPGGILLLLLAVGTPSLLLLLLKVCLPLKVKDLTPASINQGIMAQNLTLHLWPHRLLCKKIRLAMISFDFLLKFSFLAWVIANPEQGSGFELGTRSADVSVYKAWALETSIFILVIGCLALLLNMGQILFQDEYVAKVLSKFPGSCKEEDPDKKLDEADAGTDHTNPQCNDQENMMEKKENDLSDLKNQEHNNDT